jgi:integrase/recombinase XerD
MIPLLELDGRYRSAVTLPEYRLGMRPANYGRTFPVEVLTLDEVQRLIGAMPRRGHAGPRNRALTGVMVFSGLRIAETLALRTKDVDLDRGEITILHGKGDKRRTVGLPPNGVALIEAWLVKRAELDIPRRIYCEIPPLFCVISRPRHGRAIHSSYVREMLAETAVRAGIEKHVHPHGLRHTNASHMADQGVPMNDIRVHLGHSSLATTERYLSDINPRQSIGRAQQVNWQPVVRHDQLRLA